MQNIIAFVRPPAAPAAWRSCSIGSCQRHEDCMYQPCRNARAEAPVPQAAVFDVERRYFLAAVGQILAAPDVTEADKAAEIDGTISAIRQMAALAGVDAR